MATKNIFEHLPPIQRRLDTQRRPLAAVVILGEGEDKIVWRALAMGAGWTHVHACGRHVHQWAGPQRPSHVQCPGCRKWVAAP